VSRLSTVSRVLAAPEIFSSRMSNAGTLPRSPEALEELKRVLRQGHAQVDTMLTLDPPAQTRYRKTVGRAFSSRRILALEPRIREIAIELIAAWPEAGRIDFAQSFAVAFPVRVIAEMLSMPREREADIKQRWSDDSVATLGVAISDERRLEAARGLVEMQRYWVDAFDQCRREPRDDFVSELVQTEFEEPDGRKRTLQTPELLSIVQQLMVAGNETTTKFFNETMKLLVEHPDEWHRIQRDPGRIPALVEEGLRLSSPNQGLFRQVLEDVELEGVKVPKGSTLRVMFGSANRDERTFPDPDRFDPGRENLREHVAFGRGARFCIGAPLARLEARVAFEELAGRLDTIAFAPGNTFEYEPSYILRGLRALALEIRKRGA
jgi:cytochrome P450